MDIATLTSLIAEVGFPIVAVIAMAYFIFTVYKNTIAQHEKQLEQVMTNCQAREDKLFEQIDKFGDTLNSFNTTLIKIDARLEAVEHSLNR